MARVVKNTAFPTRTPEISDVELNKQVRVLFDPKTSKAELHHTARALASTRRPEALKALEDFRKSSRGQSVEWIDVVVQECIFGLLSPETDEEEQDYIRVELWRRYEDELGDVASRLEACQTRILQLRVEKSFLFEILHKAPASPIQQAIQERLQSMDGEICAEQRSVLELHEKQQCLEFLSDEIEKAIESPLYREYGKRHIGVNMHRDCDFILSEDEDELLTF